MNTRLFNVRSILVGEAPKDVAIKVKGWVRTRRDSKAGISFIHLSDGSSTPRARTESPESARSASARCLFSVVNNILIYKDRTPRFRSELFRVLDLKPIVRSAEPIWRAEAFRHDALAAELAGMMKHDRSLDVEVLIEHNARMR